MVETYRSYGTSERVVVRGRVLDRRDLPVSAPEDSWWRNLRGAWARLESDEIPGARVRIRYGGVEVEAEADGEGFIVAEVAPGTSSGEGLWRSAEVELVTPAAPGVGPAEAPVMVPGSDARFGVVSDLDDTVIRTGATDPLAVMRHTLFGNVHTRLPYPGVGSFYRALAGASGLNPFFYVSSTPWNLYDVVVDVLALHDIPSGAVLLRDWGVTATELLPTAHGAHKRRLIHEIFETYPGLPFVLIGDSGQQDPEIYREVVAAYGARVRAVYIRDVASRSRAEAVERMGGEIREAGTSFVLGRDLVAAAADAAATGLIPASSVPAVEADCRGAGAGTA